MVKTSEKLVCRSVKETRQAAANLATTFQGGEVAAFFGELGSGKTTFIQALAAALGVRTRVISPTFVFIRSYRLSPAENRFKIRWFYHLDLYRAAGSAIVSELGLTDLWLRPETVVAIEWADRIEKFLPYPRIEVHCLITGESEREFVIARVGDGKT